MNISTKRLLRTALALAIALMLAACALTEAPLPTPTPDPHPLETQIAASIFATQTASAPTVTNTPAATATPEPSNTPRATSTAAPRATGTAAATATIVPETVVTSTLSSGWIRYEMQTSKFSVALPPTWRRIGMSASGLEAGMGAIDALNPKYSEVLSSSAVRSMIASGIRFYALDLSPQANAASFPTAMNVLKLDIGVELPLSVMELSTVAQLEKTADPSAPISHKHITIGGVDALEFKYLTKLALPSKDAVLLGATQYVVAAGTFIYVVTIIGPSDFAADNVTEFEQIGQTFRLLK